MALSRMREGTAGQDETSAREGTVLTASPLMLSSPAG